MGNAVFVTGATGIVGSSVVSSLLADDQQVIAAVRSESSADALPAGTEARVFDFDATAADRKCAEVLISAHRRRYARWHQANCVSVVAGVQGNRKTPHHAVEQYLKEVDAPFTNLRPNFFMQNLSTTYAKGIRERDEIYVPAGHALTAFIDAGILAGSPQRYSAATTTCARRTHCRASKASPIRGSQRC